MQPLFWYQTAEGNIKKIFVSRIQHRYLLIHCTHVIHDKYLQLGIVLMESVSSKCNFIDTEQNPRHCNESKDYKIKHKSFKNIIY